MIGFIMKHHQNRVFISQIPIGSMYGIYANIWGMLMVNVTLYSIHGSYGIGKVVQQLTRQWRTRRICTNQAGLSLFQRCGIGELDHSPSDNKHTVHSNNGKSCSAAWKRCNSIPVQFFQTPETMIFSWDKTDKTISFSRKKGCITTLQQSRGDGISIQAEKPCKVVPPKLCLLVYTIIPWKLVRYIYISPTKPIV